MMNRRLVALAIAIANVVPLSVAHECGDGSHVKCMDVTAQSILNAPRATGGKGATGSPFCTPAGKKVYCLKEHSYHNCAEGEEPCCQDGSNPSHHSGHEGGSNGFQCPSTPEAAQEQSQTPAQAPTQILFDDMDLNPKSSMVNAFEGSYRPCMEDAYNGQFHHDWAATKGKSSYTFKVNVSESGCYKLEEYHPGKSYSCARYLPSNAQLDVKYCRGKSKTIYIDQSIGAARWNALDSFSFYKGVEGELTMRNHVGEKCVVIGSCFWVVDAFRLTRTGDKCAGREPEPEPEPKQIKATETVPAAASTSRQAIDSQVAAVVAERDGTLLLQAFYRSGFGGVQLKLEEHKGTLETVLAAHLGHESVEVHGIWKQGRRLYGGNVEHLKINFVARNVNVGSSSQTNLQQALQDAFDQKGAGITFQSATASWGWSSAPEDNDTKASEDNDTKVVYIVVGTAAGAVGLLCLGLFMCRRRMKRNAASGISTSKTIAPEEEVRDLELYPCDEKKEVIEGKGDDGQEIDVEILSVSTDTPGSEDGNSEGSNTVTPSISLQQEAEVTVEGKVVH